MSLESSLSILNNCFPHQLVKWVLLFRKLFNFLWWSWGKDLSWDLHGSVGCSEQASVLFTDAWFDLNIFTADVTRMITVRS